MAFSPKPRGKQGDSPYYHGGLSARIAPFSSIQFPSSAVDEWTAFLSSDLNRCWGLGIGWHVPGASKRCRSGNQNRHRSTRHRLGGTEPYRTSKRILFDE